MSAIPVRASLLATAAAVASLGAPAAAQQLTSVEWLASARPTTPDERSRMFSTARVRATYEDGTQLVSPLSYRMLYDSLARVGGNVVAPSAIYDENLRPIPDPTRPGANVVMQTPDGSALMAAGGKLYHIANFEYAWLMADGQEARDVLGRILPSSVVLTELSQDPATGALTPVSQAPVDFGPVGGLTVACNATVSPWGTFLTSSEDYSADARQIEADRAAGKPDVLSAMTELYFGGRRQASPYQQGVIPEIRILADGGTEVVKHYAIGRGTYEMVEVLPDQRTVYGGHDGTNKAFTMFVADRPGDLSSGTLYAARLNQTDAAGGGAFTVEWVKLGHANDAELKAMVDGGITFSDIFETADGPKEGFVEVFVGTDKTPEYLKVKNAKAAAFLETMRFAAIRGATSEFRKAEGLAFDPEGKRLFFAISDIDKGMLAGKGTGDAGDQMRIEAKVDAGAVYALPVTGGQTDTDGAAIDSPFVAVSMSVPAGLLGRDLAEPDAIGNTAALDRIANPDNLYWSAAYKTLFIGEDSGMHRNNTLWAWQDGMNTPVPLLFSPTGAELTGLRVQEAVGGHPYMLTNAQHVGDFEPGDNAVLQETMALINARWADRQMAPLGYVTGLPRVVAPGS